jgi:hypothetical protein
MASGNSSNNGRQIIASLRNRSGANSRHGGDDYSVQDQDDYDDYISEQQQQVMTFFSCSYFHF